MQPRYRDETIVKRNPSERAIHHLLKQLNPSWTSLDLNRPDFWDGEKFVEIKLATVTPSARYKETSYYFPDLFFSVDVDEQIDRYPRPLLVIVYRGD